MLNLYYNEGMNTVSRTVTGVIGMIIGASLAVLGIIENPWLLIYAILFIVVGFFILFNKKEDEVEEIKYPKN